MDLKRGKYVGLEKLEGGKYGFHGTALEEYLNCPRKFYYRHILGLRAKQEHAALGFGSAIHFATYVWYCLQKDESFLRNIFTEVELKAMTYDELEGSREERRDCFAKHVFSQYFATIPNSSEKCSLVNGLAGLQEYFNIYRDLDEIYEPRNLEIEQKVLMPNGTLICITLDRLFVTDNYIKVVDLKTTSASLSDFFWKRFENSFQLKGYYYGCQQIYDVDNVQIDGFHYPMPVRKTNYPTFERRSFIYTDLQMEDYLITYDTITGRILEALKKSAEERPKAFHTNETSCSNYGGCPYLPVCKHGFTHPTVKLDFKLEETGL